MQIIKGDGTQAYGVDAPHYMGPAIIATRDIPVRIKFYNLLPTEAGGDLFIPVDTTVMGAGIWHTNLILHQYTKCKVRSSRRLYKMKWVKSMTLGMDE